MNNRDFIIKVIDILGNDTDPAIERRLKRLEDAVFGLHNIAQRPDVKPPEVKLKRKSSKGYQRKIYERNAIDLVYDAMSDSPITTTTIQRKTGVKLRTVQSRCSELVSLGMAERTKTNHYRRVK